MGKEILESQGVQNVDTNAIIAAARQVYSELHPPKTTQAQKEATNRAKFLKEHPERANDVFKAGK